MLAPPASLPASLGAIKLGANSDPTTTKAKPKDVANISTKPNQVDGYGTMVRQQQAPNAMDRLPVPLLIIVPMTFVQSTNKNTNTSIGEEKDDNGDPDDTWEYQSHHDDEVSSLGDASIGHMMMSKHNGAGRETKEKAPAADPSPDMAEIQKLLEMYEKCEANGTIMAEKDQERLLTGMLKLQELERIKQREQQQERKRDFLKKALVQVGKQQAAEQQQQQARQNSGKLAGQQAGQPAAQRAGKKHIQEAKVVTSKEKTSMNDCNQAGNQLRDQQRRISIATSKDESNSPSARGEGQNRTEEVKSQVEDCVSSPQNKVDNQEKTIKTLRGELSAQPPHGKFSSDRDDVSLRTDAANVNGQCLASAAAANRLLLTDLVMFEDLSDNSFDAQEVRALYHHEERENLSGAHWQSPSPEEDEDEAAQEEDMDFRAHSPTNMKPHKGTLLLKDGEPWETAAAAALDLSGAPSLKVSRQPGLRNPYGCGSMVLCSNDDDSSVSSSCPSSTGEQGKQQEDAEKSSPVKQKKKLAPRWLISATKKIIKQGSIRTNASDSEKPSPRRISKARSFKFAAKKHEHLNDETDRDQAAQAQQLTKASSFRGPCSRTELQMAARLMKERTSRSSRNLKVAPEGGVGNKSSSGFDRQQQEDPLFIQQQHQQRKQQECSLGGIRVTECDDEEVEAAAHRGAYSTRHASSDSSERGTKLLVDDGEPWETESSSASLQLSRKRQQQQQPALPHHPYDCGSMVLSRKDDDDDASSALSSSSFLERETKEEKSANGKKQQRRGSSRWLESATRQMSGRFAKKARSFKLSRKQRQSESDDDGRKVLSASRRVVKAQSLRGRRKSCSAAELQSSVPELQFAANIIKERRNRSSRSLKLEYDTDADAEGEEDYKAEHSTSVHEVKIPSQAGAHAVPAKGLKRIKVCVVRKGKKRNDEQSSSSLRKMKANVFHRRNRPQPQVSGEQEGSETDISLQSSSLLNQHEPFDKRKERRTSRISKALSFRKRGQQQKGRPLADSDAQREGRPTE